LRRTTNDAPASIWAASAFGLIVAGLTAVIYLIAQQRGFPDLGTVIAEDKIAMLKADYLAKLLWSVMVTAVLAGADAGSRFQHDNKEALV